jgi:PAS domain S-box-containing protein
MSRGSCVLGEASIHHERDRKGWMERVHPEDRKQVEESLDAVVCGMSEEWRCEHRFRRDDGSWLWVENTGRVVRQAPDGSALEILGTTRDLDDVHAAALGLAAQSQISEAAGEIAHFGFWEYDIIHDKITWSRLTREILEVGEAFVPSPEATYALMPPDDARRLREAFELSITKGVSYDLCLNFITQKGRPILCRTASSPFFGEEGELVKVLGFFQDVTEQVHVEEGMRAFFFESPDFQATLDVGETFYRLNGTWSRELGFSTEELSELKLVDIIHPDDRSAFATVMKGVWSGNGVSSYETRVIRKEDGGGEGLSDDIWMSWSMSASSRLKMLFVSGRCITKRKRVEAKHQEALLRAEEANRAKSEFLGIMSHEMRTPLNPIIGFAELLLRQAQTESEREILQAIADSGAQMLQLIEAILNYSQLDSGRAKVLITDFTLQEPIDNNVKLLQGLLEGRPILFEYSVDYGELDVSRQLVFKSDVDMIGQILRNLLSNAVKFTKEGKVSLFVKVLEVDRDTARVSFSIEDTGIGISAADQRKLFQPFTQVDSGPTREFGGAGLGLVICKRFVDLLDGTFSFESSPGEGSVFTFSIPMRYAYR